MLAGLLTVVVMQAAPVLPAPAGNQTVTVNSNVTVQVPPPDPQATADMASWSFEGIFINVLAPTLVKWTNDLFDIPDFVRHTPPDLSYGNSAVKLLAETVRNVALALIATLFIVWGIVRMMGQQPPISRPFAAAALAGGNLIWWQIGIDLLNRLNDAIAPPDLRSIVAPHLELPSLGADPAAAFGPALLVAAYCVVTILLLATALFRLGLLDMLIVVGSLGWICLGSEQTTGWYQTYQRVAMGTLFSQVMIVAALRLAPILGVIGGGFVGSLLGLVVLLLARKMPSLMTSSGLQQGGRSVSRAGLILLRRAVAKV